MIVKDYTIENGLPHNTVHCALKDADGFMWFGTWYGLCSFDGTKFKTFNNRDDYYTDIPPHKIQTIVEAKDGNLWIKTVDHKLYLFDKRNEYYYDVFNEIKKKYAVSPKIIKIQRTEEGNLLLLTKNKDLLKAVSNGNGSLTVTLLYDSQSKRERKLLNNLLIEDKDYINWIGMDFKIISCKKGAVLKSKPSDFVLRKIAAELGQEFSCAYLSGKILWLGDNNGYIYKIDFSNGNVTRSALLGGGGAVQNIISVNGKNLFVTIASKGVFEYDERTSLSIRVIPLSGNQVVSDSYVDSYDKLWLEINQSSVIYYDPFNKFVKHFILPVGKVNLTVKMQDGKELGMFFLTTSGDLASFDRSQLTITLLNEQPELKLNGDKKVFFDILLDKDNILWLTSTGYGISRISFPKQQFNLFQLGAQNSAIPLANAIKTMFQARNGDIWVATRQAEVYHLDRNGKPKQIFSASTNFIGNVYHIMEDSKGNLWFSTKGNGLVKAEVNSASSSGFNFTRFVSDEKNPSSISGNDVYYTFEDSSNHIWVGLFGGGLNLISKLNGQVSFKHKFNSFEHYPKYGLYTEVRNITEDKNGRIWVGTSDGLMSFDSHFKQPNQIDFEIYRNESVGSNISDNDIYVLYKDAAAQIWVSVFGGGLNKMVEYDKESKRPVFKSYSMTEVLNSDVILSIVEDNDNALWLATENGLSRFDKNKETFRNFDRYDGFVNVQMEEESVLKCLSGDLWFGTRKGILAFNPQKIETYNCEYKTFIVDFLVSNRSLRSFKDKPIHKESVRYANSITLDHNQSTFVIEFAALNYYNQNRVSYKYILEGFEKEWHFNGKNRIASYPNIPPGEYIFKVQTIDEANDLLKSEKTLEIIILPPWWLSWWAYTVYAISAILLVIAAVKAVLFTFKMRNDIYIEQRVSELKIKFFTNISHELRTPLTLIMGPIQELKQKQQLSEKGNQYVALIEKSANQMLQLVNQILDFRKIQNGKMILHVSHLDLNKLIESFHKEFVIMSEENEISYSFQLADDDILLWADKEKLETVIRNVLSNAFKFTEAGGSIFVTTGLTEDGLRCFVKVEDSGVGIPQNKIAEIFERFSQGENSKKPYYLGTGIGLALSKEIVSMHHGTINAESTPGKGSVFTIELLLGKEHYKPSEANFYVGDTESNISAAESELITSFEDDLEEFVDNDNSLPTLLVVEDNKDLCDLLRLQLEDKYNIYVANNGVEGLKKIRLYHPDIVVTDQMMPEMSGMEMLQQVRKDFQISHIPVIVLTAKNDEEVKLKAISMGANAYITKPFNKEYLIARIEQLLSDRKVFREKIWKAEETVEPENNDSYENYLVKKDIDLLDKIHQVIEKNLDNSDFNIDTIAVNLGLSRSAFFKKLKSLTGLAPVDIIKEIRLNKSVELLKNTDMTISEIAFTVGFKEAGYFGKCFRKKYEMTPTEYMSKYRKS